MQSVAYISASVSIAFIKWIKRIYLYNEFQNARHEYQQSECLE